MRTLENRADIELMVNEFYNKVREDTLIGPIFDNIAHVNWDTHLPKMYDFWENILFGTGNYKGSPMLPHLRLSMITPMTSVHFERWKKLFYETIDEHFEGDNAANAKLRAENIAEVMLYKVSVNQLLIHNKTTE